ncbi:hypothetical protein PV325_002394 [Microctonus aethiopoides]|nr:hypothetical protein PV325_002394 [Microctonus aethiopoides]KAK0092764.1 hypothetical protein PV326_000645 [Microctonus aethiopoides]
MRVRTGDSVATNSLVACGEIESDPVEYELEKDDKSRWWISMFSTADCCNSESPDRMETGKGQEVMKVEDLISPKGDNSCRIVAGSDMEFSLLR